MMSFPWASTKARASCAGVQPLLCSKPCDPIHQFQISAEILRLETGHAAAPIVVGEITKAGGPGGQELAAKRTICYEADAKLAHRME